MGKKLARRGALVLGLGLLSGCLSNTQLVQVGMLAAPLSYLLGLLLVYAICRSWKWREPVEQRLPLLLLPALVLALLDFAYLVQLSDKKLSDELGLFLGVGMLLIPFMAAPLAGVMALVWRLWFALAPRSSLEGGAMAGAALFFLPGVLLSHDLIPDPRTAEELTETLFFACLYGGYIGTPVVLALLSIEAWLARRSAEKDKAGRLI